MSQPTDESDLSDEEVAAMWDEAEPCQVVRSWFSVTSGRQWLSVPTQEPRP